VVAAPATVTTAVTTTVIAPITIIAVAAPVVASLRHYDYGARSVIGTSVAVIRTSRRIVAVVGAAERSYAATKREQTQEKGKNEGFRFHDIGYTPQRGSYEKIALS